MILLIFTNLSSIFLRVCTEYHARTKYANNFYFRAIYLRLERCFLQCAYKNILNDEYVKNYADWYQHFTTETFLERTLLRITAVITTQDESV